MSLSRRLLAFGALIFTPLALLLLLGVWRERQQALAAARDTVLFSVREASFGRSAVLDETKQLLSLIAVVPEVRAEDWPSASALLADLQRQHQVYANLRVSDPDGTVLASALPITVGSSYNGVPWFQHATQASAFTVSTYFTGPISGNPGVAVALPIRNTDGRLKYVLSATIGLTAFSGFVAADLPPLSTLTVVDRTGMIMASEPEHEWLVGKQFPVGPLMDALSSGRSDGIVESAGADGVERVYAYGTLSVAPGEVGLHVIVGIPRNEIFADANRALLTTVAAIVAIFVFMLGTGIVGTRMLVLRPLAAIAQVSDAVSADHLDITLPESLIRDPGEFGELARAMDKMVSTLRQRAAERAQFEIELRASEDRLIQSNEQYRRIVDNAGEGIWTIDAIGNTSFVNPKMAELLGYSADEMAGRPLLEFMDAEAAGEAAKAIDRRQRGIQEEMNFRFLHKSGRDVWTHMTTAPFLDAHGRYAGALALITDITDRLRAEEALNATAQRLALVLDNITDGFFTLDRAWRYTDINEAGARMVGRTAGELRGRIYLEAFPEAAGTIWERTYGEVMNTGVAATVESYYEPLDQWFEASVFPYADGISVFFRDISDRKRSERLLRDERDRLRQIFDAQFGFIALLALDGTVVEVNQNPLTLMGLQREEVLERSFWDIGWLEPGSESAIQAAIQVAAGGEIWRADILARFPGVGARTVDFVFSPVRDGGGIVRNVIGFGVDITDRKHAESALQETTTLLQTVLASAPITIFATDSRGVFTLSDGLGLQRIGLKPGENVGVSAKELYASLQFVETSGAVTSGADVVERTLQGASIIATSQLGDVTFENRIGPLRDPTGKVIGIVGVATDITERHRVEERLQHAQAEAHVGSWELDMATNRLWWSDETFRILGYLPDAQIPTYDAYLAVVHPDDREFVDSSYQRAREVPNPYDLEHRLLTADGQLKYVRSQVRFAVDEKGTAYRSDGTLQDVSAQMQAELRQREAQQIAKLGSWELDLATNQLVWSDEIFRIFEVDAMRFGASYDAFLAAIHPDDRALVDAAFTASVANRTPYEITHRLLMTDGRLKWVQERGQTHYDASGRALRSVGTVQDITERKHGEERIRGHLLEKETLLREIHHRVKNNLQVIAGLVHFQAKKLHAAEGAEAFADLRHRIFAMTLLHERLYQSPDVARVAMDDYLRGLVAEMGRSSAPRAGIRIDVAAGGVQLPIEIAMPSGMIVSELVTNVLKYAFPESHSGTAIVGVRSEGERLVLAVDDDGVGFPEGFDPATDGSFGWELIRTLGMQIDATIDAHTDGGAHVRVSFSAPAVTAGVNE